MKKVLKHRVRFKLKHKPSVLSGSKKGFSSMKFISFI